MNNKDNVYVCGFCGKAFANDIDGYVRHVAKCGSKLKTLKENEEKEKYLEEVNAAINRVKEAEKYYKDCLAEFKEKYPKEYKLNFAPESDKKSADVKKESKASDDSKTVLKDWSADDIDNLIRSFLGLRN